MLKNYKLVKLDIKNAFNSLPHETVCYFLNESGVAANLQRYIISYLQFRYSYQTG